MGSVRRLTMFTSRTIGIILLVAGAPKWRSPDNHHGHHGHGHGDGDGGSGDFDGGGD